MKVLYVEDNPANVFLVKRVAKMGQHEIVNYIDGDQAIQKFDEIKPDLVLMDIQLAGGMSGLDVVKKLRADGIQTPIIAVTAYAMVGDKERCIEAGCTDYLAKPLPIPRLVEIFKHYSEQIQNESTEEKAETAPVAVSASAKENEKAETAPVATSTPVKETEKAEAVTTSVSTPTQETEKPTVEATKTDTVATSNPASETSKTENPSDPNTQATVPATDAKASDTDAKPDIRTEATPEKASSTVENSGEVKSNEVIAETETTEAKVTEDITDVSSNTEVKDTMDEKPVTPVNVTDTVDSKEEVSTGGTL